MSESAPVVPRDVTELRRLEQRGQRLKFLYFWGHRPPRGGGIGSGCLSQWWQADFAVEGVTYRSAEQCMMAEKAWLFGDERTAARILAARDPGEIKALGRQVARFDEETWEAHRYAIVVRANVAKFGQHPQLRDYLLTTGRRVLVEASPVDRIWGIGLAADDDRAARPAEWRGLNLLGFALMDARAALGC
ncbi:NADAR family protein [Streptomyces sp. N2-109]|uniref:NADAR family protein n=1 Tax=Streptomyces gossypii TaxID=2883101 RepID=A0ABT2JQL5_9ACTN|nr:NADAR family protein [Streptomyces gossypii]MCT2590182.1 NADAR family protein [Streptomyces gossypii]